MSYRLLRTFSLVTLVGMAGAACGGGGANNPGPPVSNAAANGTPSNAAGGGGAASGRAESARITYLAASGTARSQCAAV